MNTFSDVVDAADNLSMDEQETLLEILRHRIAQRNRARIVGEVAEARAEFQSGETNPATAKVIMDEVVGES